MDHFGETLTPRRKGRSARYIRNQDRILDAVVLLLGRDGWGALSPSAVARECGLSVRPISYRFGNKIELAVAAWRTRLSREIVGWWQGLFRDAGLSGTDPEAVALAAAFARGTEPSLALRAAIECVVIAHFHPPLAAAIREDLAPLLRDREPIRSAQRAYVASLALGLLLIGPRVRHSDDLRSAGWEAWTALLLERFATPGPTEALPEVVQPARREVVLDPLDDHLDALLRSCLRVVAERGFDGATTVDIAEGSGFSEGLLFGRYRTKAAVVNEAVLRLRQQTMQENLERGRVLVERYGVRVAQASEFREAFASERRMANAIALEFERMAAHEETFREHVAKQFDEAFAAFATEEHPPSFLAVAVAAAIATGLGILFLPLLAPDLVDLPFASIIL